MAVTHLIYGKALDHMLDADIDWTADTIKVALATSSYSPDQDADDFFNDVTNEVANGNGYTSDGATLGSPTRTYSAGSNTLTLDAADTSWTTASFTARHAVIYKDRGGATSADELLSNVNFGGDETVASGTFQITWHANGIITLTVS